MIVGKPQLLKKLNSDIVRDLIYKEGSDFQAGNCREDGA